MPSKTFYIKYLNQSGGVESVLKSTQQQALNLTHTGYGNFHNSAGNWRWDDQSKRYVLTAPEKEVKAVDKVEKKESKAVAPPKEPEKAAETPSNVIPFKTKEITPVNPKLIPNTTDQMLSIAKKREEQTEFLKDFLNKWVGKKVVTYDYEVGTFKKFEMADTSEPQANIEIELLNGEVKSEIANFASTGPNGEFRLWAFRRPEDFNGGEQGYQDFIKKTEELHKKSSVNVFDDIGQRRLVHVIDKDNKWAAELTAGYDLYVTVYDNIESFGKRGQTTNVSSLEVMPNTRGYRDVETHKLRSKLKYELQGQKFDSKDDFVKFVEDFSKKENAIVRKIERQEKTFSDSLPNFAKKEYKPLQIGDFTFTVSHDKIYITHLSDGGHEGFQGYIGYVHYIPKKNYDRLLKMQNEIKGFKSSSELGRYLTTKRMGYDSFYSDPDR